MTEESPTSRFVKNITKAASAVFTGVLIMMIVGLAVWVNSVSVRLAILERTSITEERLRQIIREELTPINQILQDHNITIKNHEGRLIKLEK